MVTFALWLVACWVVVCAVSLAVIAIGALGYGLTVGGAELLGLMCSPFAPPRRPAVTPLEQRRATLDRMFAA